MINPKVTVMVANYNTSAYLAECLSSLINQTYSDFEALIVDDGSTDKSLDIISSFIEQDNRFRLMKLEKNHGLTYVRHVGLSASRGEYIAILDADDVSMPDRLEKQVRYLDSHPEVVLIGGYYGIIDSNSKILRKKKKVPLNDPEIRWWLTFGNCLIHSTIMYRRKEAIACGGYETSVMRGEDMELHSKLISAGKAEAIPHVIAYWRTHKDNMTKSVPQNELNQYFIAVVQRSIQSHIKRVVDFNTASAAFYNTKNPGKDYESCHKALGIIEEISDKFIAQYTTYPERKIMIRCILKHLCKMLRRNKFQPWWKFFKKDWINTVKLLIANNNYRWYIDSGLFFPLFKLSIRNYLLLIQVSMSGSFKIK